MAGYRQPSQRARRAPRPISAARLEELALAYVARFATSAAKLEHYLRRKLRERGWDGEEDPDVPALVARFVEHGYVDDAAYARARSSDLLRRGYGGRRVRQALGQAGVAEELAQAAAPDEHAARKAALYLARKRGFGPFALQPVDREKREKAIAAMLRAGHSFEHARAVIDAETVAVAETWVDEAEGCDDDRLD